MARRGSSAGNSLIEFALGGVSALIVVVVGIYVIGILASATGQDAGMYIILLLGVGIVIIAAIIFAIIKRLS